MDLIDLESSLDQPPCPICGKGPIQPIDIFDGEHLTLQCRIPECMWAGRAKLPEIRKKIIYLDTSTVSHMARALKREETGSPGIMLYEHLKSATSDEAICCPGSSILEDEAELSSYSREIVRLSREFGDPGLKHELQIERSQMSPALQRYLSEASPTLEINVPIKDAFKESVHSWLPIYNISANLKTPEWLVEKNRTNKVTMRDQLERIYRQYKTQDIQFEEIQKKEAHGLGEAMITIGIRSLRRRAGLESTPPGEEEITLFFQNTFDICIYNLRKDLKISLKEAIERASDFFLSEHFALIPVADIKSKLHAGLAMLCRGATPRLPKSGDVFDIDHIATFMPYMDIFIADRFFADLCNQHHLQLGDLYSCEIRSLGPADIPDFISHLDKIVEDTPQTPLARKILNAILEGGFHKEFAERAEAFLRARGIDPYAKFLKEKKGGEPDQP